MAATKKTAETVSEKGNQQEKGRLPQAQQDKLQSRPAIKTTLELKSIQAQKVMNRSFEQVSKALFSLDVILRTLANAGGPKQAEKMQTIENELSERFSATSNDLEKAKEQLDKLLEQNAIESTAASYTDPKTFEIEITTPSLSRFIRLVVALDELIGKIDILWLNGVLDSNQRTNASYQWQQRLIKLAGKFIGESRHAWVSYNKTKAEQADSASESTEPTEADLEAMAAVADEKPTEEDVETTETTLPVVAVA